MFEGPLPTVLVILAVLGVGIAVYSLRRRRQVRRLCLQAAQAIQENRQEDALQMLLAAERSWAFSAHDGSRSSRLNDLVALSEILTLLARVPGGNSKCLPQLESAISEIRALFAEPGNFAIDGRSMKRDVAILWPKLSDNLESHRRELRESYRRRTNAAPS